MSLVGPVIAKKFVAVITLVLFYLLGVYVIVSCPLENLLTIWTFFRLAIFGAMFRVLFFILESFVAVSTYHVFRG